MLSRPARGHTGDGRLITVTAKGNGGGLRGFDVWFRTTHSIQSYARRAQTLAARDSSGNLISQTDLNDLLTLYTRSNDNAVLVDFDRRFSTPGLAKWLVTH